MEIFTAYNKVAAFFMHFKDGFGVVYKARLCKGREMICFVISLEAIQYQVQHLITKLQ